jgi:subtilisin family serine protease
MGKRAANGLGAAIGLLRRRGRANSLTGASASPAYPLPVSPLPVSPLPVSPAPAVPARAAIAAPEPLEQRVLLSSSPVTVDWDGRAVTAVPNQYIVYTTNIAGFDAIARKENFTALQTLGAQQYLQFNTTLSPDAVKALAVKFPTVMGKTEPNAIITTASVTPNDAYFSQQYALDNTGQVETFDYNTDGVTETFENQVGTPGDDIDATQAWQITTGSRNVVVAVIDTGIDLTNPDLAANIWTNPNPNAQPGFADDLHGWNFVANDNDVTDDNGHGTNVSGIIGAVGNNSIGVSGVNWAVSILPVKALDAEGSGEESDLLAAINYVTMLKSQGVNVVVMSLSLGNYPFDVVTNVAFQEAAKAGVLATIAAGNNDSDNDSYLGSFPGKYSTATSNIITVAALDNQGKLAPFSNYGANTVNIGAPGINILSTAPTYTVDEPPTPLDPTQTNPAYVPYGFESGTSQATPQVAGVIALEAAANPSATPQQLKAALLDGARYDPALASVNGLPALVSTSGELDAYTAVQDVLNYSVSTNTTRHGNWVSYYGSQGAYVVGDSTTFPSFVTGSFSGGTPVVLQDPSSNTAALQEATSPASRIEAYDASASTETINLDFTDGVSHQVALYVADLDHRRRTEMVQIVDALTGAVLGSQTVSNFAGGQYLVFDLSGDVQIVLTNLNASTSAVFSGIFFDPVPTTPTTFVSEDTSTLGTNWRNAYGSAGDLIVGDNNAGTLPTYVSSVSSLASIKTLSAATKNAYALNKNQDIYHNIAAYWTAPSTFDVDLDFSDTLLHQVTLYAADYDHKNRSERIQVINASTGAILNSQDITSFSKGAFLSFDVSGSVIFRVINTGGPSAVLSGIFFDNSAGENGDFEGVNSYLGGTWTAAPFAQTNAFIAGYNFPNVDDFGLTNPIIDSVTGASERVLSTNTFDGRALQSPADVSERIEGYIYSNTSMTLNLDFGDNLQHEMALYFADYERFRRSEYLTIVDTTTGQVLAKQRVTNFQNGKYFVYDVTGAISITITNAAYPNAVLSGIFTD